MVRKSRAGTKKHGGSLDPIIKNLNERKRLQQVSRSLLPDAPPRKRQSKSSPERVECRLTAGTPSTPPAPKLQPWQLRNQHQANAVIASVKEEPEPTDTANGVMARQDPCISPIRRQHQANAVTASVKEEPEPTDTANSVMARQDPCISPIRRQHQANAVTASVKEEPEPTDTANSVMARQDPCISPIRKQHQANAVTASVKEEPEPTDTANGVMARQDACISPISTMSTANCSPLRELLVDFTSGRLKTDLGNSPFSCSASQQQSVSPSVPKVGKAPPTRAKKTVEVSKIRARAKKMAEVGKASPASANKTAEVGKASPASTKETNLGSNTENTASNSENWVHILESDDEVDEQMDGQTDMPLRHQLTPAHADVVEPDLHTWLIDDDKDSDQLLTKWIPTDNLKFDWVQDHTSFRGKRETFTGIAGPTFPVTDDLTPLDIFLKFFDDELFDLLIKQTNKYASEQISQHLTPHSRLHFFVNVDRAEMARFLAILILQGLLAYPVEKNYWGEYGYLTLRDFKKIMTFNRFILLKRLLHFSDSTDTQTLPTDEKKLRKIKPVLDLLQKRFSSLYLPRQEIAIDESLLKWQGRLSFAQRIATKAARVGIKSYELCESGTGYLWRFFVYTGGRQEQTDGLKDDLTDGRIDGPTDTLPLLTNATSKIVHELVKPLYNRGHTLVMDNFYNSPLLARFLKSQGTDCYGTLRVNREHVPEAIKKIQKHELREGELVQSYTGDLSVVLWRDSNLVSLLSTYHDGIVGGREKDGRFRYKPQVVLDYNRTMGGVDKKDQLLSAFPIERVRNIVWYKKVFRRLLNVTLVNAHIIFRTRHMCTPRDFRMQVAEGLIKMSQPPVIVAPGVVETLKLALARKSNKLRPILKNNHFICSGPYRIARCEWCKKSRTKYICKQCGVSLCLEVCFEEYHTVPY